MFSVFGKPSEREQQSMRIPRNQLKVMHKMPCVQGVRVVIKMYIFSRVVSHHLDGTD